MSRDVDGVILMLSYFGRGEFQGETSCLGIGTTNIESPDPN